MGKVSRKVKRQLLAFFLVVCMIMQNGTSVLAESIPTEQSPAGTVQDEMLMTASDEAAAEQPEEAVVETPEQSENQGEEIAEERVSEDAVTENVDTESIVTEETVPTEEVSENSENKEEAAKEADAEAVKEEKEEKAELPTEFTYEDDEKTVTAVLADAEILPEGAKLVVKNLTKAEKAQAEEKINEQLEENTELVSFKAYDVHFEVEGKEIEPENGKVSVKFEFKNGIPGVSEKDDNEIQLIHIKDSGEAEKVDVDTATDAEGIVETAEFEVQEFSTFAYAEVAASGGSSSVQAELNSNSLGTILSNMTVISFGDTVLKNHNMGAVLVKGAFSGDANGFMDDPSIILPSYIEGEYKSGKANGRSQISGDVAKVYVGGSNKVSEDGKQINGIQVFGQGTAAYNNGYVNWDSLLNSIETEMNDLSSGANQELTANYDWETIKLPVGGNVKLNTNGKSNIKLEMNGSGTDLEQIQKGCIITIEDSGTVRLPLFEGKYPQGEKNDGMGVIWVIPNASEIIIDHYGSCIGHILAPQADIIEPGDGDYNGCLVGKNVSIDHCEGHVRTYKGGNGIIDGSLPTETPMVEHGNIRLTKSFSYVEGTTALTEDQKNGISFTITGPGTDVNTSTEITISDKGSYTVADNVSAFKMTIPYTDLVNNSFELRNVPVGDYTITENNADITGYDCTTTITNDGKATISKDQTAEVAIGNEYEESIVNYNIDIFKRNIVGEEIGGAAIKITDAAGNTVEEWTSEEGRRHTVTVQPGTYKFHEETAPTGYIAVTDIEFTVDEDGTVTVINTDAAEVDQNGKLIVTDEAIHFVVNKTDVTGETELAGAVIKIYEADEEGKATGDALDTWTSAEGETHDFGAVLEAGKSYVLSETTAPKGYTAIADTAFRVKADGSIETTLETKATDEDGNPIYLVEDAPVIHFVVNKTDVTGETELEGAVIEIYAVDEEGNAIGEALDSWTSVKDAIHDFGSKLEAGKSYVLSETTAPNGYTAIADTAFRVKADGSIETTLETKATDEDGNPIYLVEDAPVIHFVVNKTDVTGETELAGAVIKIYEADEEGKATGDALDTWTSAEGETHDFGAVLEAGKSYVLSETTAPNGYTAIADTTFRVKADGSIETTLETKATDEDGNPIYLVEDAPVIHFVVNKTDVTGETELAGAVIKIYEADEEGKATGDALDTWTSAEGETHDFGAVLKAGKSYVLSETTAPKGYTAIADTAFRVKADGSIETTLETKATDEDGNPIYLVEDAPVVIQPETGILEITKTIKGDITEEEAEGALKFKVTNPLTNQSTTYTLKDFTHAEGSQVYTLRLAGLVEGRYEVEETTSDITGKTVTVKYAVNGGEKQEGTSTAAPINKSQITTVAFEDDYKNETGILEITKTIKGDITEEEAEGTLTFKVTNTATKESKEYTLKDFEHKAGTDSYVLKLEKLKVGNYEVEETTKDIDGKSVTVKYAVNGGAQKDGTKAEADITNAATTKVAFEDEYKAVTTPEPTVETGILEITKTIKGDITEEEAEGALTFKVTNTATKESKEYTLKDFEHKAGTDSYVLKLEKLKVGNYEVEETTKDIDGKSVTVKYAVNGGAQKDGTKAEADITNAATTKVAFEDEYKAVTTPEPTVETGILEITKTIKGDITEEEAEGALTFKVTNTATKESKKYTLKDFEHKAGTDSYVLKLEKLKVGNYEVEETTKDIDGKSVTVKYAVNGGAQKDGTKAEADITNAATTKVAFEDEYKAVTTPEPTVETGILEITKTIKGDITEEEAEGALTFKVTNTATKESSEYTLKDFEHKAGTDSYVLKLEKLKVGNYEVEETTKDIDGKSVTVKYAVNGGAQTDGTKAEADITSDATTKVDFEDEYKAVTTPEPTVETGILEITKTIKGDITEEEAEGALTFKVTNTATKESKEYTLKDFEHKAGTDSYVLKLEKLEVGSYEVEETTSDITGKTVTVKYAVNGGAQKDGTKAEADITSDATTKVAFEDEYKAVTTPEPTVETGILEITKTIKGDITEEEAKGALKFKVTNPLTNQSTTYTLKDFTHAEGSKVYTLSLAGLVEGRYEVEETTTDITGKTVTVKYAVNGGEKQEGTSTAAPINRNQIATVAFENDYKNIHFNVNKTELGNGKEVEGAKLQVIGKDKDGKEVVVDSWTSKKDETHDFGSKLKAGEEYTLRETNAPEGYSYTTDIKFSVGKDGKVIADMPSTKDENGNVTYLVEDAPISFNVNKTELGNGKEVEGAKLQVIGKDKDGKEVVVDSWTSKKDETHDFGSKLKAGEEYTLRETNSPEGYSYTTDIKFSVGKDGKVTADMPSTKDENGNVTYLVEDAPISFNVNKTELGNGKEVEGAKLQVIGKDKDGKEVVVDSWTSKKDETHDFGSKLKAGEEYTLRETNAPEGYSYTTDINFKVEKDGTITTEIPKTTDEEGNVTYLVEDAPISFNVNKTELGNGKEVEGAKLQVIGKDKDGKEVVVDSWTSKKDETHDFGSKLKAGEEYTLRETNAPEGYSYTTDIKFSVGKDGKVTADMPSTKDENGNVTYLVEDAPISFNVNKTELGNGKEVEGAKLQVIGKDKDGKEVVVDSWTSKKDETHDFGSKLKAGEEYTLRETNAPEGYSYTTDINFKVEKDGTITTEIPKTTDEDGNVTYLVEDAPLSFNVNKTDLGNGEEVEGAKLEVLDKDGKVVDSWTSKKGETHDFGEKLKAGEEYTLRETNAPEGYEVVTDIKFSVNKDGTISSTLPTTTDNDGKTVYLVNDKKIVHFNVNKTELGTGVEVEGAELQVIKKDKDGTEVVVDSWTSKKEETHDFGNVLNPNENYILRETVAPVGYKYVTDILFSVNENSEVQVEMPTTTDENGNVTYLVEDAPISFNVNKTELGNGKEVEGAKLQVIGKDKDGKEVVVDSWTSKKGETHDFGEKLKAGEEYTLRETNAPEGYSYTTDLNFKVEKDGTITTEIPKTTDEEGNVTYLVEDAPISFNVNKTELGNGEEVEGAKLEVLDKDGKVVDSWTSKKNETHDFGSKLKAGEEYTLRETNAPEGYSYTTDINFKVEKDGTITTEIPKTTDEEGNVTYLVEDAPISFNVNKTELGNGKEVEGAKLEVLDKDGKVVDSWTSKKNETHDFGSKLKVGEEYTLRETVAPEGYSYTTDIKFSVGKDGKVTADMPSTKDENGNVTYLVEDAPISFNVNKTELGNGKEVEGAKLEVLDKNGKVVDSWTSKKNETHDFGSKLKAGEEYTLRETVAPEGYSYTTDIKFSVGKDGKVTADMPSTKDENGNVTYLVEDAPISFNVNKTELGNGKEVEGAKLEVLDKDGKVVDSWTSKKDETHDFGSKLKAGEEYTLRETNAPEGYSYTTDIKFSVGKDGKVTADMPSTKDSKGNVTYLVEDEALHFNVNKTELGNGKEVEGAKLEVLDKDGKVVDSWTSKKDETHDFGSKLKAGEEYTLRETNAPEGYSYTTDIKFSVGKDGKVTADMPSTKDSKGNVTYLVEDEALHFNVNKTELGNGKEVEGAKLEVLDKDGKVVDSWTSKKDETHDFGSKLKAGEEYTLRETNAPEGYSYTTDIKFSVGKDGKVTADMPSTKDENGNVTYLVEDAPISFNVNKTELGNGKEVEGAKLEVLDKDGKVVESWTSKKDETYDFGSKLKAGEEYTLRETVAPEGYSYTTDIKFSVGKDGKVTADMPSTKDENGNVTYLVEDAPISFNVNKTELGNGKEVEGAKLEVLDKDGKVVDSWTSKKDETHDFGSKLKAGEEYTLRETNAPEGYSYTTDLKFKVEKDGTITTEIPKTTDEEGNVTYLVEDAPISFNVNKTDLETGEEVEGAKLEVVDKDGNIVDSWTSKKGETHDFGSKLSVEEKYILRETVAPKGYSYTTDIEFSVEKDGKVTVEMTSTKDENGNVTYLVEDSKLHFILNEKTKDTEEEKDGAEIVIEDEDGNVVDKWTSEEGKTHDFGDKLEAGKEYTLKEKKAPHGYLTIPDMKVVIKEDGTIETDLPLEEDENGNSVVVVKENRMKGTIYIHKVNEQNPDEDLPGSTYGLYKIEENDRILIAQKVTDENGMICFDDLDTDGIYEVQELKAPDGSYVSKNPIRITFDIDKDNVLLTNMVADGSGTAKIDPETGEITWFEPSVVVRIHKVDKDNKQLAGAKLQILDKNGKEVVQFTTTDKPEEFVKLFVIGETYTLKELEAPAGYKIADPVKFTISDEKVGPNEDVVLEVKMVDEKKPASNNTTNKNTTTNTNKKATTNTSNNAPKTGDKAPIIPTAVMCFGSLYLVELIIRRKVLKK